MARKIFDGCTIALSGKLGRTHGTINDLITLHGGDTSNKVDDNCTHLICSATDFGSKSTKVQKAEQLPDIKIVKVEWLYDSTSEKKKLSESKYLWNSNSTTNKPGTPSSTSASQKAAKSKTNNKKRSRSDSPSEEPEKPQDDKVDDGEPAAKKVKDGQKANTKTLVVPIDEACGLGANYHVYIDPDGLIYDAALNLTNAGANSNKFYRIQVLTSKAGDFRAWARWGRVGETGQHSLQPSSDETGAINFFEKKFREKTGHAWVDRSMPPKKGKYAFIEKDYEEDDADAEKSKSQPDPKGSKKDADPPREEVKSELPAPVQRLMELIFNMKFFADVMQDMNYDANKLPLGQLSKKTLDSGYKKLKELANVINDPNFAMSTYARTTSQMISSLTDDYYTIIPHAFGRHRPPLIGDARMLQKEVDLLQTLGDMEIANDLMQTKESETSLHPLDHQYQGLGMQEMTPLDKKSKEFKELHDYLVKSHGQTHHMSMKVQEIFRIERQGERKRFDDSKFGKMKNSDRRLLWHGSRTTNFGGILSQGLRIAPPEAPVNGYMFGKGIYLADISSKSANYCSPYISANIGLLLLCEAELGKPMLELHNANSGAATLAINKGKVATLGKGRIIPKKWKDASCVNADLKGVQMPDVVSSPPGDSGDQNACLQYNEYIAYDVTQVRLRYLFRVEMK